MFRLFLGFFLWRALTLRILNDTTNAMERKHRNERESVTKARSWCEEVKGDRGRGVGVAGVTMAHAMAPSCFLERKIHGKWMDCGIEVLIYIAYIRILENR